MSDRSYATIELIGRDQEAAEDDPTAERTLSVLDSFYPDAFAEHGSLTPPVRTGPATSADMPKCWEAEEISLGSMAQAANKLIALGWYVRGTQDGSYSTPGEILFHLPTLGTAVATTTGDGDLVVSALDLDAALAAGGTTEELRNRIEDLTLARWRRAYTNS